MKIRSTRIRRYKSLNDFHMENINDLAVIVGQNSSGKTTFLEALVLFFSQFHWTSGQKTALNGHHWFCKETSEPIEFALDLELDDIELERVFSGPLSEAIRESSMTGEKGLPIAVLRSIDASGTWKTASINIAGVEFISHDGEPISINEVLKGFNADPDVSVIKIGVDETSISAYVADMKTKRVFNLGTDKGISSLMRNKVITKITAMTIEDWCKSQGFIHTGKELSFADLGFADTQTILSNLATLMQSVLSVHSQIWLRKVSHERTALLDEDITKRIVEFYESELDEEVEIWNEISGIFGDEVSGKLVPAQSKLFYEESGIRYPLSFVGGGYQGWLALVWHIVYARLVEKGRIVLIEEPESHLHPSLARKVFKFIRSQSQALQIFITSHSTVFLDQCEFEDIWQMSVVDGASVPTRIKGIESLREIASLLGVRPSDVMIANNILFVEGPTDVLVIHSWAKLMGILMDYPRVKILPMKGVGKARYHLGVWTEAATAAGIPIFVLLDGDEAGKKAAVKLKKRKEKTPIDSKRIYNLEKENIEDYYPSEMILEALANRFTLSKAEAESLKAAIESEKRVKEIENWFKEHKKDQHWIWKAVAAEFIAEHMKKKDIPKEIRNLLNQIDEIFEAEE